MLRILATALLAAFIASSAHAQTYQTFGNFTYGSDGSVVERLGSTTIITPPTDPQFGEPMPMPMPQPPTVCQTFGNMTVCN
jgi:hypothetical protein